MEIFVSYSSKDESVVKQLCGHLKKNNISYWVSYENTHYGIKYAETIISAIDECKIFLVVVSKASNISTHVINEINSAVMRGKIIFPILLDNVKLSPAMEYYLASNQYLNYENNAEFTSLMLSRIHMLLGKKTGMELHETDVANADSETEKLIQKADNGDAEAQCEIGRRYYIGANGLNKNFEIAVSYFLKAAEQGNKEAQCNIGWCYESGDGVAQSWEDAFRWYVKSADNNCAMAQYSLGWMYHNGIYVPKNWARAVEYFALASENGHAMAQYRLGMAHMDGIGVDQNCIIANHWLMLAADQGIVFAQYQIALNFFEGKGCKRDIIKAKELWLLSAEKGYRKSADALEKYYDIFYMDEKKLFLV